MIGQRPERPYDGMIECALIGRVANRPNSTTATSGQVFFDLVERRPAVGVDQAALACTGGVTCRAWSGLGGGAATLRCNVSKPSRMIRHAVGRRRRPQAVCQRARMSPGTLG